MEKKLRSRDLNMNLEEVKKQFYYWTNLFELDTI